MELEWKEEHLPSRAARAVPGAVLGAALGVDCLLALAGFGEIPMVLGGALLAWFSLLGGELTAGRPGRDSVGAALPWVLLFDILGHHLCFALEAAPGDLAGIRRTFFSLAGLNGGYWLRLASLLTSSLLVWGRRFRKAGRERKTLIRAMQPVRMEQDPAPADLELYLPDPRWIRPHLLVRRFTQGLWLAVLFLCLWLGRLTGQSALWLRAAAGVGFSLLLLASLQGPAGLLLGARDWAFVRQGERLWRIPLRRMYDLELGVPLYQLAQSWDLLPQPRRRAFRDTVAALLQEEDEWGEYEIEKPSLDCQSPWEWALTDSRGRRYRIGKVYPGFTPVPGEAERVRSAPPVRRINPIVTVVITAACLAAGLFMGLQDARRPEPSLPEQPAETEAEAETETASTKPIVPEVIGDYIFNGVTLRTDDNFQASTSEFLDPEHGAAYRIELQFGVDESAARFMLERTEGEDPRRLREDGGFLWRLGENGVAYQYDLRTVRLSDGRLSHTGAALSERGTMLAVSCTHGDELEAETARGTILYMLENLQFTGPAITEENYQDQLRPAVSMGFNYCGQAFFKAPAGMYPYDVYLDTFLPCGGEVHYYDGGISMMTQVHGLRVSAAVISQEDGTALDVVKGIYQDLKDAGRQYDEGNYFEDAYNQEGNNACRAAVYYDGGRTRVTALVAMEKWKGCYLFKELTCLPEEMDGDYKAVFQEMEKVCGVTISVMEDLGSQRNRQEAER